MPKQHFHGIIESNIKIIFCEVAMEVEVDYWKHDCIDNSFVSWTNDIWMFGGVWFTMVQTKIRDQSKLIAGRAWYFQCSLNTAPVFAFCSLLYYVLDILLQWQYLVTMQYSGGKWRKILTKAAFFVAFRFSFHFLFVQRMKSLPIFSLVSNCHMKGCAEGRNGHKEINYRCLK